MTDDRHKTAAREALTRYLADNGKRCTPERLAMLDAVSGLNGHFTVDDLWRLMCESAFAVSRATVYNNVSIFERIGVVRRQPTNGNVAIYERVNPSGLGHLHLVCTRCGKVKAVNDNKLMESLKTTRYSAFHPEYASVNIYGVCSSCARKKRKK